MTDAASLFRLNKFISDTGFSSRREADKLIESGQVKVNGQAYWQEYWASRADLRIDWPSQERIRGKIASDYIWPQLKKLSADGTCARGCIFVNHSTFYPTNDRKSVFSVLLYLEEYLFLSQQGLNTFLNL